MIQFFVPHRAFSKARPRFGKGRAYTSRETIEAEKAVWWYAEQAAGSAPVFEVPVSLTIEFRFLPAASWSEKKRMEHYWHGIKPDLDNLEKLVMDALSPKKDKSGKVERRGLWRDDCLVARKTSSKFYQLDVDREGTLVTVEALE